MKFPALLLKKNKKKIDSNRIKIWHYMYARHKPSSNWKKDENLPDFTKIRTNQSFNWCNYSIPVWVRFNDKKIYQQDFAVTGFKVDTIRNKHVQDGINPVQVFDIEHKPLLTNYSHCEMKMVNKVSKSKRREIRMTFRHKCIVPLKPNQTISTIHVYFDIVIMFLRRFITKFSI